jgi:prolyl oligopeptidase
LWSCLALRRLEDPDSEETKEFVAKQAELAETVLAGCPDRENLRREVTRLFDHPRYAAPFHRGNKYFHFHNSGLQAQSVLYMQVCHELSLTGSESTGR